MAYEVLKTIGTKRYRYRVQSERDAVTGKKRNRWTYIGRVDDGGSEAALRPPRRNARARLLAATQTLLAGGDAAAVTADAIAREAGLAHGTFYRYFRDRADVLEAAAREIRARMVDDERLDDRVANAASAATAVSGWVSERLRAAREKGAAYRAWSVLVAGEPRLAAYREERRAATSQRLCAHLDTLRARGWTTIADVTESAQAIIALIDGTVRATILEGSECSDARIAATAELVVRAIFA